MDAGAIYRRLPGLTEGEAVALALAYHLGAADADTLRATGGTARTPAWNLPGAGQDAGRGRIPLLLGALGGMLDVGAVARLVEWYAAGWDDAVGENDGCRLGGDGD